VMATRVGSYAMFSCAVKMRVGDTAAALVSDAVLAKGSTRDGLHSREATTSRAPLYDTRRALCIRAL